MSHIFLSYSAEDRERVRPLVALLDEVAPVWWDQAVRHGENWEVAVETAVEQAGCVVVAWTRQSVKSSWVRAEAGDARDRTILIPAMLEDVKVPLAFRHLQTAQLQDWDGNREHPQAQALQAAVAAVMSRQAPSAAAAPPLPASPSPVEQRRAAPSTTRVGDDRSPSSASQAMRDRSLGRSPRRWFERPVVQLTAGMLTALVLIFGVWPLAKYLGRRSSSARSTQDDVASPLATPATSDGISASVPSATTPASGNLAPQRVSGVLATDTATADLSSALALASFEYLVDRDGRTVPASVKVLGDRVRVGVVHGPPWIVSPYQPYTDAQIAGLVALLTTLAHDKGVDLGSVDFGDDPKLSELAAKGDEVRDRAAKLLAAWRSSGVMPDEARISPKDPPR